MPLRQPRGTGCELAFNVGPQKSWEFAPILGTPTSSISHHALPHATVFPIPFPLPSHARFVFWFKFAFGVHRRIGIQLCAVCSVGQLAPGVCRGRSPSLSSMFSWCQVCLCRSPRFPWSLVWRQVCCGRSPNLFSMFGWRQVCCQIAQPFWHVCLGVQLESTRAFSV